MSPGQIRWPMSPPEKRILLLGTWAVTAVGVSIVSVVLLWQSRDSAIRGMAAVASAEVVRAECTLLESRIDSLIEQSRAEKSFIPVIGSEGPAAMPELATTCGLSLIEYSVAAPTGKRSRSGDNRWKMVCVGPARAWGRFLSSIAYSSSQVSIESATWSCKGVTDRDVRGDVTMVVNR